MRIHSSIVSLIQVAFRFLCVGWIYFSGLFWWSFWKAFHFLLFIKREMEPLANANIILKRKFNFEYAFWPLCFFSSFFGLWPFSIIYDSNGTIRGVRIFFFDVLRSIVIICLNVALSLESYEHLGVEQKKTCDSRTICCFYRVSNMSLLIYNNSNFIGPHKSQ